MTYPASFVREAAALRASGLAIAEIARRLNVSRAAVREWTTSPDATAARRDLASKHLAGLEPCPIRSSLDREAYAYLLGMYLGDGCLSKMRRVHRLRIACCDDYPEIMDECEDAIQRVLPRTKVGRVRCEGCHEVGSYSTHWVCLFPQHAPGRKHERSIELASWQAEIVREHVKHFIRGLIHSDGCRCINRVKVRGKRYEYPRYFLSNESRDILLLFGDACDLVGVEWRFNRYNSISVAKRESVALLDSFVGPKT